MFTTLHAYVSFVSSCEIAWNKWWSLCARSVYPLFILNRVPLCSAVAVSYFFQKRLAAFFSRNAWKLCRIFQPVLSIQYLAILMLGKYNTIHNLSELTPRP